jgi:translocation and assembly module TamB
MKLLRFALLSSIATLAVLLTLATALWSWTGADTSLASALDQISRVLPANQTLSVKDVTGSLREGGRIGWLRWQRGPLSVEATEIKSGWTLHALWDGELRLTQLSIQNLRIDSPGSDAAPTPPTPPTSLQLPIRVDAAFLVNRVEWVGATPLQFIDLAGNYVFDSKEHRLDLRKVQFSSGNYRLQAQLGAQAPMALSAMLQGSVQTTVPASARVVTAKAVVELQGTLGGRDAELALRARLEPKTGDTGDTPAAAMQASVAATLRPWQEQQIVRADARWQGLDLAALWPQAPQTNLAGEASVTPEATGWRGAIALSNSHSGPWNQQRLPLDSLNAKVVFVQGQWTVESLAATGAGGHIQAQGQVDRAASKTASAPAIAGWQGSAVLRAINPARLDSRLAASTLDGQLSARQTPKGIAFDASVKTAPPASARQAPMASTGRAIDKLNLKAIHAQGTWAAPTLQLDTLVVQTDTAQLQGQLTFHTNSRAAQGHLALTLPGAHAKLDGAMSSTEGQGAFSLQVTDTALAARWLATLPGGPQGLGSTGIQGNAAFTGGWQGGWGQRGKQLKIQANLQAPQLTLRPADQSTAPAWVVRDLQAKLSGTLAALDLGVQGQMERASGHFALQAQMHGGQQADDSWQAMLSSAQFTAQDRRRPGLWTLALSERVTLNWKPSGSARQLALSAGAAQLKGPVPGVAKLQWQAAHWSTQGTRSDWQTQGQLDGLPLAWLDLVGQTQMANLGLRGDLLFGGQWQATGGDTLQLSATLARTSGDLLLQTDDAHRATLSAGVRDARLAVTVKGDQLAASFLWDSERGGQAKAQFSSRLQRENGIWRWPGNAALQGTLRAELPPVGAWSLLAPPGWRLRGTVDANAELSGTLAAPQWFGTLIAKDLAVRSVADDIDFSQGELLATIEGQRVEIINFTMQGAGGSSGGQLRAKGFALWLPATDAATKLASRLRMELDIQADNLRVSNQADRRLAVSGNLSAKLADERLLIRGGLKADQALFVLKEDSAPELGQDVVVRRPASTAPDTKAANAHPTTSSAMRVMPDIVVTLDLGPKFELRGRGLATRLGGKLELTSAAEHGLAPRLTGDLRAIGGTYKAYGQNLAITVGVLRFSGPYNNPSLNILAIRPNLQQRVGVQISGTTLSPVVRLYADPELPDAEKLAWLVLGHSGANGGAEAAVLQQAALALLGGSGKGLSSNLAEALGLDELSVRGAASSVSDGSSASAATVTLGKRVSRDFYVAYERSLAGTLGTFYIFYDLSRRFTLRAQTGEQSAVDLIFTLRYD